MQGNVNESIGVYIMCMIVLVFTIGGIFYVCFGGYQKDKLAESKDCKTVCIPNPGYYNHRAGSCVCNLNEVYKESK